MKSTLPFISFLLPTLLLLLQHGVELTTADCCGCGGSVCADGTGCSFFSCCAHGACNIFCCNCSNGCRTSSLDASDILRLGRAEALRQDSVGSIVTADLKDDFAICREQIAAADVNGDGNLSFIEWAHSKAEYGGVPWETLVGRWSLFDWEGKGYLTMEEALDRKF